MKLRLIAVLVGILVLAAGLAYGLPRLQLARADRLLSSANAHIGNANRILSQVRLDEMGAGNFTSEANIARGAEAAGAAPPLLEEARQETVLAAEDARRARGLLLLPSWYRDYWEKKEEVAGLRLEQTDILLDKSGKLNDLYLSGSLVFTSVEEMDRLWGQFESALGSLQGDPSGAQASLEQVSQSMRQIQAQLDAAYAEQGFQLLKDLSGSYSGHADLVELYVQLAAAVALGDQARVQQSASLAESRELRVGSSRDYFDLWWRRTITPLEDAYADRESRQQELDAEAALIYGRERPE